MKKLFIFTADGGDGSFYPQFTMNEKLVDKLGEAYHLDLMHYDNGIGIDGDGFHYKTLNLPDECTPESLGISVLDDNYADQFFVEDDE